MVQFPNIFKGFKSWWAVGIIVLLGIGLLTGAGRELQAYIFGNPCGSGQVYDSASKACLQANTQLQCGTTTYLKYSDTRGYTCETSNIIYILVAVGAGVFIYYYMRQRRPEVWREARFCLERSINGRHLMLKGRHDFVDAWQHVREVHQIIPHSAWLFIGEFVRPGAQDSVMIIGTDDKGWVIDKWEKRLEEREIRILRKEGIKLEQALAEVAKAQADVKRALEIFDPPEKD